MRTRLVVSERKVSELKKHLLQSLTQALERQQLPSDKLTSEPKVQHRAVFTTPSRVDRAKKTLPRSATTLGPSLLSQLLVPNTIALNVLPRSATTLESNSPSQLMTPGDEVTNASAPNEAFMSMVQAHMSTGVRSPISEGMMGKMWQPDLSTPSRRPTHLRKLNNQADVLSPGSLSQQLKMRLMEMNHL